MTRAEAKNISIISPGITIIAKNISIISPGITIIYNS
jgi:hypothetical protein